MTPRVTVVAVLTLIASPCFATCSEGDPGRAYDLGLKLAMAGVPTTAAAEVPPSSATCFVIGYREGRLQRLLRTSQPHPPGSLPLRPRNSQNG